MAITPVPVSLNKGLDLTTPPLAVEPGSLIDCLNYEMISDSGYKRVDGYERFDGYPNGSVYNFYVATIVADNPANQSSIVAGCRVARAVVLPPSGISGDVPSTDEVGIVVQTNVNGTNTYAYVPYSEAGVLLAGQAITVNTASGTSFTATVTVNSVDGKTLASSASAYMSSLRSYASILRGLVQSTTTQLVGLWWLGENLYGACNAYALEYVNSPFLGPFPSPGSLIRHKGVIYRVLGYDSIERSTSPVAGLVKLIMRPTGSTGTSDNNISEVDGTGVVITTYGTSSNTATATNVDWAYVVKFNGVGTSTSRGYTNLRATIRIPFDAGTYTSEIIPTQVSVQIKNAGGTVSMNGQIEKVITTSGTFGAGTAAGHIYVSLTGTEIGGSSILDNFEIWYNSARLVTVNAPSPHTDIGGCLIAGNRKLDVRNTRYQTIIANFYGDTERRAVYGSTGASRAFWANSEAFGNIWTQENTALDMPKYVAYHSGTLALGFDGGSVQKSIVGEPLDYTGSLGAMEVATGDKLTGLLELPGDALVAFGQGSIRRIERDGSVTTISSHAGCYDYTAVLLGQDALFCGPSGISTLSQSQAYGDFEGKRTSHRIAKWLRNRMSVDNAGFETGGVAMAYQVRSKNQYRLVLKNGDTIVMTATENGYKPTLINYGLTGTIRVPYAWSSSVSDSGKERVHIVWDYKLAERGIGGQVGALPSKTLAYELGQGWGFDGVTFRHYFVLSHFFPTNGAVFCGIEKVRMYGTGYGQASLNVTSAGIEEDFDQDYQSTLQDLSLPATPVMLRDTEDQFTNIVDLANRGLGVKLKIEGSVAENLTNTEPSHVCQVLVLYLNPEGAQDA